MGKFMEKLMGKLMMGKLIMGKLMAGACKAIGTCTVVQKFGEYNPSCMRGVNACTFVECMRGVYVGYAKSPYKFTMTKYSHSGGKYHPPARSWPWCATTLGTSAPQFV